MIKLGTKVTDTITGFSGIATSRTEFQFGCVRVRVQPKGLTSEGKIKDDAYIDELLLKENDPETTPTQSLLLGTKDEDIVTGMSGIITSYTTYLVAGPRVCLQPRGMAEDGKPMEGIVVDVPALKSQQAVTKKIEETKRRTSGPGDVARAHSVARQ